jgi:serine/threonine-protein kinase RsbW
MTAHPELFVTRKYALKSEFAAIVPVCAEVRRLLAEKDLAGEWFKIELLLREAFINAAQHGNNLDPRKTVECEITIDNQNIEIRMRDEGPGFDWQAGVMNMENEQKRAAALTGDPAPGKDLFYKGPEGEALVKESGRGFSTYRLYSDGFEFHDSGREVVITKQLERSADDGAPEPADTQAAAYLELIQATDGLLARLHGSLTAGNHDNVMPPLLAMLAKGNVRALFIDMSGAGMIDSKGIGSLIALRKECLRQGCTLTLAKVPSRIMELFRSVNLHRILDMTEAV